MSAYVIRQLRAEVDDLRRRLVVGEPVGIAFARTVRTLHDALAYYERTDGPDAHRRALARPNVTDDEERHARAARR